MGLPSRPWTRRQLLGALSLSLAATLAQRRAAEAAGSYDGPLFDAHAHLRADHDVSIQQLVSLYDEAGVEAALLFGEPWALATAARDSFPGRIVPMLAEGYSDALHPDSSYANPGGLKELLAGGFVRGLGEVICRHSPFTLGASGGYASFPATSQAADHPTLLEAYRLAGQFSAPVTIHQEWFFADELERALSTVPATRFIWAHGGHGPAEVVAELLGRHPNLLVDLSARTPWIGAGTVLHRADGSLDPRWATLLTARSERFLVGLDLFVPSHYRSAYVRPTVSYYRGLLGQLEPAAAARIAFGNARALTA